MKFEFLEGKHGTQILITPETVEETGRLLRKKRRSNILATFTRNNLIP